MKFVSGFVVTSEILEGPLSDSALRWFLRGVLGREPGESVEAVMRRLGAPAPVLEEVMAWEGPYGLVVAAPGMARGPGAQMELLQEAVAKGRAVVAAKQGRVRATEEAKSAAEGKRRAKAELVRTVERHWTSLARVAEPLVHPKRWGVKERELVAGWALRDGYSLTDIVKLVDFVWGDWDRIKLQYKGRLTTPLPTVAVVNGFREDLMVWSKKGFGGGEVRGEYAGDDTPEVWK